MTNTVHLSGHCLCGAISYTVGAEPIMAGHCACDNCRHGSGAEHASLFAVPKAAVQVTGKTSTYSHKADSGATVTRHFCPTCGSPVFAENTGMAEMLMFTAGTLDRLDRFHPGFFVFHAKRAPFDKAGDGIQTFDAMPPAAAMP